METIRIHDKEFVPSIPAEDILVQVRRVANEINKDYEGQEPLFLVVLNGSFIFAADLMREITLAADVSFVKLASYQGTASSGTVSKSAAVSLHLHVGTHPSHRALFGDHLFTVFQIANNNGKAPALDFVFHNSSSRPIFISRP